MIQPHDACLLRAVGAGSIHFCGDGEHLIEALLEIPDLRGVDCGEPEKMDRQRVYGLCAERRVAVTGWQCSREELVSGQARRDYPTGAVLLYLTEDIDEAREVVAAYQKREA
jgi:hypothetical protein